MIEQILDGKPDAVRPYLAYFWDHWSGPNYRPSNDELNRLAIAYGAPGAMVASINYYRAGAGTVHQSLHEVVPGRDARIAVQTTVLWPGADSLVRIEWADRLHDYFADVNVRVIECGHFVPLEAPDDFAAAIAHTKSAHR